MNIRKVVMSLALALGAAVAVADTVSWRGGDGAWSDDNWDPRAPQAGDDVLVESGTVTLSAQTPVLASLTVTADGVLSFDDGVFRAPADLVAELRADAVAVTGGGTITHAQNRMQVAEYMVAEPKEWKMNARVFITCGTLTVDADSAIDVAGKGYGELQEGSSATNYGGPGPGGCTNLASRVTSSGTPRGGGGHGGAGSWSLHKGAKTSWLSGLVYDSLTEPIWCGSGGDPGQRWNANFKQRGGFGGGAVRIVATGAVVIDGSVSANSLRAAPNDGGSGSGGSVWITCQTIAGAGLITASSVRENSNDTYGGGGRISVAEKLSDAELEELALGGLPATHVYVDWISAVTTSVLGGTCTGGRAGEGTASYVYNAAGKTLVHVVPSNGILVTGCDPVYGDWPLDSGAPATFTAPEHGFHPDNETWRYPCLGFAVSNLTEEVTNGTARTLVYLVGDEDVTVYWKWGAREFGHPIAKTPHGVVEADGVRFDAPGTAWPREGEKLTLRAVPDAGAEFLYWQGDVPWGSVTNATLVLEPSEQRVVWAVFRPASAATTVTWLGGEGDWNDPAQWDVGNVPGRNDDVVIAAGTCRVDQCGLAGSLALSGDALLTATPTAMTTYRKNAMLAVTRNLAMTGRAGICFGRTNSVADVSVPNRKSGCRPAAAPLHVTLTVTVAGNASVCPERSTVSVSSTVLPSVKSHADRVSSTEPVNPSPSVGRYSSPSATTVPRPVTVAVRKLENPSGSVPSHFSIR